MIIELSERYAKVVLRSLKEREEGLTHDPERRRELMLDESIDEELKSLRTVKNYIEERLLEQ